MYKLRYIIFSLILLYNPASAQNQNKLKRYEFSHGQMGTLFNIICYSDNDSLVRENITRAFLMIDSLNQVFSDYLPESELNELSNSSGTGKYIAVSEPLFDVIRQSLYWSKVTHGIFDITVGPYTQLWRHAVRQEKLPDSLRLKKASQSVGYRYIKLNMKDKKVLLVKKDMQLDLGGIAKGYTVDKVYQLMEKAGIPICLVDGGGDIYAGMSPPDEEGWKVSFQDLEKEKKYISLSQKSIATSGDLYRYFEYGGVRYSHIIDPSTGLGITTRRSVSVIAGNATTADALATYLSVAGPKQGFKTLKKLKGVEALILQQEGEETNHFSYNNFNSYK